MRADNLIVYGRTVPEESKRYGQSVCMAGYNPELRQMMRIYPLNVTSTVKARHYITAEVERNPRDSRLESWALKDRDGSAIILGQKCDPASLRHFLDKEVVEHVDLLNEARKSLGVLRPDHFSIELKTRSFISNPQQLELFDQFIESGGFKSAGKYFLAPYVVIPSEASQQCFQIREWGIYELLRKYEQSGKQISATIILDALHITNERDVYFVVGNLNQARTIWLVIKVFCFDKVCKQVAMF